MSELTSFESLKLAACLVLLSPYLPLLFMGEEYGEQNPFLYFVDHIDPKLVEAVRRGRHNEFASFKWKKPLPDPKSKTTFTRSQLSWMRLKHNQHAHLFKLYRDLIDFRKKILTSCNVEKLKVRFSDKNEWLSMEYPVKKRKRLMIVFSFSLKDEDIRFPFDKDNPFREILKTHDAKYGGTPPAEPNRMGPRSVVMGFV